MHGLREKITNALAAQVHDPYGWLSDAQDAQLYWDFRSGVIEFAGEGSIDLGHLVNVVLTVLESIPDPPGFEGTTEALDALTIREEK